MFLSRHRQNGAHASSQRRGNKIGRRKGLSFALVIGGSVGRNLRVRRTVDCVAMQIAGVLDGDVNHFCEDKLPQTSTDFKFECFH